MLRTPFLTRLALLAASASALPVMAACLEHPLKPVELDKNQQKEDNIQLEVNKDVDILIQVDNSGSMAEEQANLAANFAAFVGVLEREDVKANYRIGITTTDNGNIYCNGTGPEGGSLVLSSCQERLSDFVYAPGTMLEVDVRDSACTSLCNQTTLATTQTTTEQDDTPASRPWIESIEGATNLVGGVSTVDAFRCAGPQGINGCGFEQHLESMYKALKRTDSAEERSYGFIRENAILAILFITDEEDCSTNQEFDAQVWAQSGNHVFWEDPAADYPTSAVCWNAGVQCTGGPGTYTECHAENFDQNGMPGASDGNSVMRPLSRYTNVVQSYEDRKRMSNPSQEVIVAAIAGVPTSYPGADIVYQDAGVAQDQLDFGIGFGCQSVSGKATPPVRLREFAENFRIDTEHEVLYSICADNYSAALGAIADAIADQVKPACFPRCAKDTDLSADGIQVKCQVEQSVPGSGGFTTENIPQCAITGPGTADWDFPTMDSNVCYLLLTDSANPGGTGIDDMHPDCVSEGWNLQFVIQRRQGFPAPGGTQVRATCELSDDTERDCPNL